jgi:hypothetical protein
VLPSCSATDEADSEAIHAHEPFGFEINTNTGRLADAVASVDVVWADIRTTLE